LDDTYIPELGDIVTRMGTDKQQVVGMYPDTEEPIQIDLVCLYPGGCFRIGDRESNLPGRYDFIRHGVVGESLVTDAEFEEILNMGIDE